MRVFRHRSSLWGRVAPMAAVVAIAMVTSACAASAAQIGFGALVGVETGAAIGVTGCAACALSPDCTCTSKGTLALSAVAATATLGALYEWGPDRDPTSTEWAVAASPVVVAAGLLAMVAIVDYLSDDDHVEVPKPASAGTPWVATFEKREDAETFIRTLIDCRVDVQALSLIIASARAEGIAATFVPASQGSRGACAVRPDTSGRFAVSFERQR